MCISSLHRAVRYRESTGQCCEGWSAPCVSVPARIGFEEYAVGEKCTPKMGKVTWDLLVGLGSRGFVGVLDERM